MVGRGAFGRKVGGGVGSIPGPVISLFPWTRNFFPPKWMNGYRLHTAG